MGAGGAKFALLINFQLPGKKPGKTELEIREVKSLLVASPQEWDCYGWLARFDRVMGAVTTDSVKIQKRKSEGALHSQNLNQHFCRNFDFKIREKIHDGYAE
jgi:hypothetical protein